MQLVLATNNQDKIREIKQLLDELPITIMTSEDFLDFPDPEETGETLEDNVTLAKTYIAYLSPAVYAPGDAELDLLSAIMTAGKASRLYKALVYDQKIAQNVSAYQASMSLRSHFNVEVTARPGVSLDDIEKAVDVVLEKLRTEKVTKAEIDRAKNQYEASFVRRMQSLATRAALLNRYQAAHGDPDHAGQDLKRYTDATADDLLRVAKQVLDLNKRVILRVKPKTKTKTKKEGTP